MLGFFSRKNKEQTRKGTAEHVGCFGKMPVHADFIRHNINSRELVSLVNWLQEGVGEIQRKRGGDHEEIINSFPTLNFVMVGNHQDRTLAGTISSSRDKSGRKYPFAMFSAIAEPLFVSMPAALPCVYDNFLKKCSRLSRVNGETTHQDFCAQVDAAPEDIEPLSRRLLLEKEIALIKPINVSAFWSGSAFNGAVETGRQQIIFALCDHLKNVIQRTPSRTSHGFRLPLPDKINPLPAVVFWVQLVESILEERNLRLSYFWNQASAAHEASLVIFFRPTPPSYLHNLIDRKFANANIIDIVKEAGDPAVLRNSMDLERMLSIGTTSMLDLLYAAGRREMLQ